jgi:hypothetical protein
MLPVSLPKTAVGLKQLLMAKTEVYYGKALWDVCEYLEYWITNLRLILDRNTGQNWMETAPLFGYLLPSSP